MGSILDRIQAPADLRCLPQAQLEEVAQALRCEIIDVISKTGGHLAASLGSVDIAVAIHHVFPEEATRITWDTGGFIVAKGDASISPRSAAQLKIRLAIA